MYTQKKCVCKN